MHAESAEPAELVPLLEAHEHLMMRSTACCLIGAPRSSPLDATALCWTAACEPATSAWLTRPQTATLLTMLCYAMLCHAMLCHALPCYAVLQPAEAKLFFCAKWMCRVCSSVHICWVLLAAHVQGLLYQQSSLHAHTAPAALFACPQSICNAVCAPTPHTSSCITEPLSNKRFHGTLECVMRCHIRCHQGAAGSVQSQGS